MRRTLSVVVLALLLIPEWTTLDRARLTFRQFAKLRARGGSAPDADWDRYYAQLVADLPARGRVGLVQSLPLGVVRGREHFMLQYALAPRLLAPGADEEFVIVCGPPPAAASLIDTSRFAEVRRLGDDLALYRRVAR
jgi:hypothetical protein